MTSRTLSSSTHGIDRENRDVSMPGGMLNPFPGLRPFREDEEHLFFGRENQVDRMIDKLARTRFLAVVGTSGSGKSSLVNCELRPALHRGLMASAGTSWRMAQFRPGGQPIRALADALAQPGVLFGEDGSAGLPLVDILEATLRMSRLGLVDAYHQAQLEPGMNLLVVVDQFEELFRYRSLGAAADAAARDAGQDAVAFVNLLLEAEAQAECPIYIVLTMRSDFLGDCAQFPGLPEAINQGQYLVPRLTRDERRAAIAGPVAVGGGRISPVLLTRLVNDVGDNPDQLSILQHALNRSWAYWRKYGGGTEMSIPDYEAIGTMAHALDRHAERAMEELDTHRKRKICEKLFKALSDMGTDARGIRRPLPFAQLAMLTGATEAELIDVINVFRKPSRSFLMPPLGEVPGPNTVIDISHESLMRVWQRLRTWAEEEARSAQMLRRISETAVLHAAGKARLWRDPDLQFALDWRSRQEPSAAWAALYRGEFHAAMAFLDASKAERDYETAEAEFERRWRRPWTFIVIGTLTSFFILSALYSQPLESWLHAKVAQSLDQTAVTDREPFFHRIMAVTLLGMSHLLVFVALTYGGRWLFHRSRFDDILSAVRKGPQATPDPPTHAGFFRRGMAAIIDISVFFLATTLLAVLTAYAEIMVGTGIPIQGGWLTIVVFAWLYDARFTSSARQATPGKMAMRIVVQDRHGQRLSFRRASARVFAKLLSYPLGIGFFIQPFTRHKRALHDIIAGTEVVRRARRSRAERLATASAAEITPIPFNPLEAR